MPFPDTDCFEVKNAKFPLDLALAFPNANALAKGLEDFSSYTFKFVSKNFLPNSELYFSITKQALKKQIKYER